LKQVLTTSILIFLAVLGPFLGSIFVVRGAGEASSSVSDAESWVLVAFNATLEAQRAGANVSGLIVRLNEAAGLLDDAEVALNSGNLSEAASMAGQCIAIAENVKGDANVLKASALDEAQNVFWTSFTFFVVGIGTFVVVLVAVWLWFKRGYTAKVLGTKPEVTSDEA
jgi:CHASE3 domain sensor protein